MQIGEMFRADSKNEATLLQVEAERVVLNCCPGCR